jgi:glycerophosphoryl diester phosphodiesterase
MEATSSPAPAAPAAIMERMAGPRVIAHRGASAEAPENTIAAFDLALARGADGIELDLRATGCGALVALHDDEVAGRTLEELDGQLPTLEAVLARYAGCTELVLELKEPRVERLLRTALDGCGVPPWSVTVQTFDLRVLRRLRLLEPRLRLVLVGSGLPPDDATWLDGACVKVDDVDGSLVAEAHARGLDLSVWTVNDEEQAARLASLGVDAILTDRPAALRRALESTAA